MKKSFFYTICVMVLATIVAVVSCKKDDTKALLGHGAQPEKTFTVPQVDDMNAYLKGFKQRMQTVTRGEDEMLGLEEAAWHLSSVANYDFANANVEFTDLRYDTLRYRINVADGEVSLSVLNALYSNVAHDIDEFYHSLNLDEKHFRFIGASVSNSGDVEVPIITSYRSLDHAWYFEDWGMAGVMCETLFAHDYYVWNADAITTLVYAMNLLEGRTYAMQEHYERTYYLYLTDVKLKFQDNYIDPLGSPFEHNSRLFAVEGDTYYVHKLDRDAMCYCLDSYLGLGFTYVHTHVNLANVRPVKWGISPGVIPPSQGDGKWHTYYHDLHLTLATYVVNGNSIEY